jgi:cell shape-determining protein MreC
MAPHQTSKLWFIAAVALLLALSLLPSRWSGWTQSLGGLATLAIAPVEGPVYQTTRWLMGDSGRRDDVLVAEMERQRDQFKSLWLQEQQRNDELRRMMEQLQRGSMYSEYPVTQLVRPVIGSSSDGKGGQLEIRAGSSQGVEQNVVATTPGVQIVGKVVGVNARTCLVRLLTNASAGSVSGLVMTSDDHSGASCILYPFKNSLLQGQVEIGRGPAPEVGQTVRLDDPSWPKSARMLVLGTITEVKTSPSGRPLIFVKPTTDLDRLSEVVLRITPKTGDEPALGSGGKGTGDGRQ